MKSVLVLVLASQSIDAARVASEDASLEVNMEEENNVCRCMKPADAAECSTTYGPIFKDWTDKRNRCTLYRNAEKKKQEPPEWCYVSFKCESGNLGDDGQKKCRWRENLTYDDCAENICQCLGTEDARACNPDFADKFYSSLYSDTVGAKTKWCYTSLHCQDEDMGFSTAQTCRIRRANTVNELEDSYTSLKDSRWLPKKIALRTMYGKFLTAAWWNWGNIHAERTEYEGWEKFHVWQQDQNTVSLRSNGGSGLWMSADTNGKLQADKIWVGAWERFTIIWNDDGTISLKSWQSKYFVYNDKWVSAYGAADLNGITPGAARFEVVDATKSQAPAFKPFGPVPTPAPTPAPTPLPLPPCFTLVNEASKKVVTIREQGHYYSWDTYVYGPGEQLTSTELGNGKWRFTPKPGGTAPAGNKFDWAVESLGNGAFALKNSYMADTSASNYNHYLTYSAPGLLAFNESVTPEGAFRAVACDKAKLPSCLRLKSPNGKAVHCASKDQVSEGEDTAANQNLTTADLSTKKGVYGGFMYSIYCDKVGFWGVNDHKLKATASVANKWEWWHPAFDPTANTVSFFSDKDYTWIQTGDDGVLNTDLKRKEDNKWNGPGAKGSFTFSEC